MGNDGGSIAKRSDLAKQKKIKGRINCESIQKAKAKLCSLTQEPLKPPIVACKLGFLYNKNSLLELLIENKLPLEFNHIKTIKDVIEVKFHSDSSSLACPVSGNELNGVNKFQVMWDCGCVLSEKAIKEIPSETCLMCSRKIKQKIRLNQSREEQKINKRVLGIKSNKKHVEDAPTKRIKIADIQEIEKTHQAGLQSDVYKSLFNNDQDEETFCCRHLRAGLR